MNIVCGDARVLRKIRELYLRGFSAEEVSILLEPDEVKRIVLIKNIGCPEGEGSEEG